MTMAWWQNFDSPAAAWLRRVIMRHRDEGTLRSDRRLISVLYSNMRDYVPLCERLKDNPEQLRALMNAYFTEMGEVVAKYNGTVEKYIGDCFSAVYNTPLASPDHALDAVRTALDLQKRMPDFSRRWEARVGGAIRCGVGISTGAAVVITNGLMYTVMGDTMNLAPRLEGLTKEYKVPIVISETTHQHLAGRIPTRELGDIVVKGTEQPVKVFAVLTSAGKV